MKIFRNTILIAFTFIINTPFIIKTKIIQKSSAQEIKNLITSQANKSTLALFDIDGVILDSPHGFKKFPRKVEVVDKHINQTVENLKSCNIPVLAITKWWTGNIRNFDMEKLRFEELNNVGMSFEDQNSPFNNKNIEFCSFRSNKKMTPKLKNNVLFVTPDHNKDEVFKELLHITKTKKPEKITFIDDNRHNLERFEYFCKENNIDFLGIHFVKKPKLDTQVIKNYFKNKKLKHETTQRKEKNIQKNKKTFSIKKFYADNQRAIVSIVIAGLAVVSYYTYKYLKKK